MIHLRMAGALWLALALAKGLAPSAFQEYLALEYDMAGASAVVLAWILVVLEGLLGIALLVGLFSRWHLAMGLVSLGAACLLLMAPYLHASERPCGCFGAILSATRSRRLAVAAGLLFLSSAGLRAILAAVRTDSPRESPSNRPTRE